MDRQYRAGGFRGGFGEALEDPLEHCGCGDEGLGFWYGRQAEDVRYFGYLRYEGSLKAICNGETAGLALA